ncbi:mannitol-1-phosphate 5-dehydrogenase [Lactiplantibacillus plantarum]|uniref:mannitol-1-phosphate 5-dehydrogenase n=1 Tax=Lactiplantibacillus TaxID=2767842 RepID=UPI00132FAEC1|nr:MULTISPECIES: mannitol-1-phosphate 5-dehydrogenase [Lactiplantibacillus]MCG0634878.1 mannitol-1-phosphate 5-dehydrogenase [Lactiplantibacillus plantarum]MBQ0837960.1 mannitol-1-phosphate 5-dehydrogenase [Lactiplantibacillus pentosus]MBU7449335.1 mannitol-1-phosphate 5-dehydrogenase [Lactiplantibacillus sp. 7.2.4]MBU7511178.1 mannitol-1-phosphate 5-dehydrogenase [Lactiplantibacillus pentosus]MCE6032083.1 mannitol-1-phosphate 5-dehydrogenase [Lactiplantibacillus pentosus]
MKAVHFGAGNIGRGFIGETLAANGFEINFVDVNETIIDALNQRDGYEIELADESHKRISVHNVAGINNGKEPEKVVQAIVEADIVTTAIGPKILKFIAPLIADGIRARQNAAKTTPVDVIACENMIGGSQNLKKEVYSHLADAEQDFADKYIGFPNAAVDRIVPQQKHDDPLFVSVEPFKEWVIDEHQMANPSLKLESVHYAPDLEPYIERKLFSVNTGHATVAYTGKYLGYSDIGSAIADPKVLQQLKRVLKETGDLLIAKWNFKRTEHEAYQHKIIGRFENKYLSDEIARVGRTPIRKLGYDERFIRPIREAKERDLDYEALLETVGMIYTFDEPKDTESQKLMELIKAKPIQEVIATTTGLKDQALINEIEESYQKAVKERK